MVDANYKGLLGEWTQSRREGNFADCFVLDWQHVGEQAFLAVLTHRATRHTVRGAPSVGKKKTEQDACRQMYLHLTAVPATPLSAMHGIATVPRNMSPFSVKLTLATAAAAAPTGPTSPIQLVAASPIEVRPSAALVATEFALRVPVEPSADSAASTASPTSPVLVDLTAASAAKSGPKPPIQVKPSTASAAAASGPVSRIQVQLSAAAAAAESNPTPLLQLEPSAASATMAPVPTSSVAVERTAAAAVVSSPKSPLPLKQFSAPSPDPVPQSSPLEQRLSLTHALFELNVLQKSFLVQWGTHCLAQMTEASGHAMDPSDGQFIRALFETAGKYYAQQLAPVKPEATDAQRTQAARMEERFALLCREMLPIDSGEKLVACFRLGGAQYQDSTINADTETWDEAFTADTIWTVKPIAEFIKKNTVSSTSVERIREVFKEVKTKVRNGAVAHFARTRLPHPEQEIASVHRILDTAATILRGEKVILPCRPDILSQL